MSKVASTATDEHSRQPRSASRPRATLVAPSAQISDQLHPRKNRHSWFAFRLFLGFFGAALVLLPLALPESWIASIFGLVIFLTSILLPPSLKSRAESEPLPEISRKIVLDGADFCVAAAPPVRVQLYVSQEQILAMKPNLQPAIVIPAAALSYAFLQRAENSWLLVLHWSGNETVFSFRGFWGERKARKAEFTIRQCVRVRLPEKPRARAAGA